MKLIIDRRKWRRGLSTGILRSSFTGKMCCLGFYCRSLGVSNSEMNNRMLPVNLSLATQSRLPEWLLEPAFRPDAMPQADVYVLAGANDEPQLPTRELQLKAAFARHGVQVVFRN